MYVQVCGIEHLCYLNSGTTKTKFCLILLNTGMIFENLKKVEIDQKTIAMN